MGLILDPSLLLTRRGVTWIQRQQLQAPDAEVFVPKLAVRPHDDTELSLYHSIGWWGRPPVIDLPAANLLTITSTATTEFAFRLNQHRPSGPVLSELWAGLVARHVLAARRTTTLDALVAAGATLVVRPAQGPTTLPETWPQLPSELHYALLRRIRFLATTVDESDPEAPTIRVFDAGTYGHGEWH